MKEYKYKIYADLHRKEGKKYVEDVYTQFELSNMNEDDIKKVIEEFNGEIYICSDVLLNTIGWFISDENSDITTDFF